MQIKLFDEKDELVLTDNLTEKGWVTVKIKVGDRTEEVVVYATDLFFAVKPFYEAYYDSLKRDNLLDKK